MVAEMSDMLAYKALHKSCTRSTCTMCSCDFCPHVSSHFFSLHCFEDQSDYDILKATITEHKLRGYCGVSWETALRFGRNR